MTARLCLITLVSALSCRVLALLFIAFLLSCHGSLTFSAVADSRSANSRHKQGTLVLSWSSPTIYLVESSVGSTYSEPKARNATGRRKSVLSHEPKASMGR